MSDRTSNSAIYKRTTLAAAIALTFATPAAFAAPGANQLPGHGAVSNGATSITKNASGRSETINLGYNNTVIQWGGNSGKATINPSQPAGFNIGSNAALNFSGTGAVLNIDASGNPSQIMGSLSSSGDLFVANGNGIIVSGSNASISSSSGMVGLLGDSSSSSLNYPSALGGSTYDGISINGKSGGNVTVSKNASVSGSTVLIASGGNVNVGDMANVAGNNSTVLSAGLPVNATDFTSNNTNAVLTVSGTAPASTTLKTAGKLVTTNTASENYTDFATNNSSLKLDIGTSNNKGTLDNEGTLYAHHLNTANTPSNLTFNTLNNGEIDLETNSAINLNGNVTNKGQINIDSSYYNYNGNIKIQGGNLTNKGTIDGSYAPNSTSTPLTPVPNDRLVFEVRNGRVDNSNTMKHVAYLKTYSNPAKSGFTSGADYSITNSGTITSGSNYFIELDANNYHEAGSSGAPTNNSTGSVINTGVLQFGSSSNNNRLYAHAYNNVTIGGQVEQVAPGNTTPSMVSASNPLYRTDLLAGINDSSHKYLGKGTMKLSTPLATTNGGLLVGQQVRVMANLSSVTSASDSTPSGNVQIYAGGKPKSGYALRVAKDKTVSANKADVYGRNGTEHPNVILQGTLSGNTIQLGGTSNSSTLKLGKGGPVSDVLSGPSGGLNGVSKTNKGGSTGITTTHPTVVMNFTGHIMNTPHPHGKREPIKNGPHPHGKRDPIKNTPHTNGKSGNFRYNYLPITSDGPVNLNLNPVAYKTNGTTGVPNSGNMSEVNILVNNDVTVNSIQQPSSVPDAKGTAAIGSNNWPNTHLVLQSTGNIKLGQKAELGNNNATSFYWPGLVYLGTINTTKSGQATPGTVSKSGTISADGNVNNVIPGSTANGGGISFITKQPLNISGKVVTNAESWVTFATDKLADYYASTNAKKQMFYGGSPGSAGVLNYKLLSKRDFHTQTPIGSKNPPHGDKPKSGKVLNHKLPPNKNPHAKTPIGKKK